MAKIDLVDVMMKPPGKCLCCNLTPHDEEGKPKRAIDLNVDVDWGNNGYICEECATVIAQLIDFISPDEYRDLKYDYKALKKDHAALRKAYTSLETDKKAVREGKRASKRIRERKAA